MVIMNITLTLTLTLTLNPNPMTVVKKGKTRLSQQPDDFPRTAPDVWDNVSICLLIVRRHEGRQDHDPMLGIWMADKQQPTNF